MAEWLRFRHAVRFFELEAGAGDDLYGHMKTYFELPTEFLGRLDVATNRRLRNDCAELLDQAIVKGICSEVRQEMAGRIRVANETRQSEKATA